MEFIKHKGELQCSYSGCNKVSDRRVIYYCWNEGKQIYWFVCADCGEWTKLSFGYEENGIFDPSVRRHNEKISSDFAVSLRKYGLNW